MKKLVLVLFALAMINACGEEEGEGQAAFVTLLGSDTLAVEQFEKTENEIEAQVVLRSPETAFYSYNLQLDDRGGISEMRQMEYGSEQGFDGSGREVRTVQRDGENLIISQMSDGETESDTTSYEEGTLPFIDMVHWPFELVLNQASGADADSLEQPLLTGSSVSDFTVARIESDSMTIRHPFRGVMGVDIDPQGNLIQLDAGQTTRKLKVHRVPLLEINEIGQRFASADQEGNSFGSLSGQADEEFSVGDTDFNLRYGVPEKRGRTIFGGIVPWGELWRTGANEATHFETSQDITLGDLEVPAGEYTLFTIPEEDGGELIINEETGQNGNAYDESRDLGRVPMEIGETDETVEAFTITVEEGEESDAVLKLMWDDAVFSIPIQVN